MPPLAFWWFAGDLPVVLFFAPFTVPQFNSAGQATSPVKTDDASLPPIGFTSIKFVQIGRTKQPK
jgi:hypothetical protein